MTEKGVKTIESGCHVAPIFEVIYTAPYVDVGKECAYMLPGRAALPNALV